MKLLISRKTGHKLLFLSVDYLFKFIVFLYKKDPLQKF